MGNRRPRAEASVTALPNAVPTKAATKTFLDTDRIAGPLVINYLNKTTLRRLLYTSAIYGVSPRCLVLFAGSC
jgi:hypothetical protein